MNDDSNARSARTVRAARMLLRVASWIVPRDVRADWLEEWTTEIGALEAARRGPVDPGTPDVLTYAAGALPHAIWLRREGWTMGSLAQDLTYAARVLRRSPGFTLVAAFTLALGIGVNASIFSLVNGLILRAPAGIEAPDRLVQIARSYEDAPRWDNWSWPAFEEIRATDRTFDDVAGWSGTAFLLGEGPDAEVVAGEFVSGNYFPLLGVGAAVGRTLQPADDVTPGAHPVAVLAHDLWRRRFGGDPEIVGRTVQVGGAPYEVVGVAPPGFVGAEALGTPPEIFVPAAMHPPFRDRLPFDEWGWSWFKLVGRLAPGQTPASARAAMDVASARLRAADPVNEGIEVLLAEGVGLSPADRDEATTVAFLLTGIAGLVLLLTCASVANLFVARASTRATEMGLRLALGAGSVRLARQLATESLLLSLVAAALAIPLTFAGARLLPEVVPYPLATSVSPDGSVLLVVLGMGVFAGLLFGGVPAVAIARRDLGATLREAGTTGATGRTRVRDALVVGQLAVSLALLSGATLLGRSVMNARSADPGFDASSLMVGSLDLGLTGRYDAQAALDFYGRLASDIGNTPGVTDVTLSTQTPFLGPFSRASRSPAGRGGDGEAAGADLSFEADEIFVGEGYFSTMGVPLLRGRGLRAPDEEPESVAVINESLARMFWPGQDPIGQALTGENELRVVGVVADVRMRSLRGPPRPTVYQPLGQSRRRAVALHVRTSGPPLALTRPVRERIAALDPGLPLTRIVDVHSVMTDSLGQTASFGLLVAVFAGLALVLSVVGLYGLIAFGVAQRVREMGIRLALGANPGDLVGLVLGRGLKLAGVGVVAGLAVALVLARALQGLLYGVGAADPVVLSGSALLLLAAAGLGAWLPARRAAGVDASVSLRDD